MGLTYLYRLTQRRKVPGQRLGHVRLIAIRIIFQRQADIQQLCECVTSCITRNRGPQLAAGAG